MKCSILLVVVIIRNSIIIFDRIYFGNLLLPSSRILAAALRRRRARLQTPCWGCSRPCPPRPRLTSGSWRPRRGRAWRRWAAGRRRWRTTRRCSPPPRPCSPRSSPPWRPPRPSGNWSWRLPTSAYLELRNYSDYQYINLFNCRELTDLKVEKSSLQTSHINTSQVKNMNKYIILNLSFSSICNSACMIMYNNDAVKAPKHFYVPLETFDVMFLFRHCQGRT